MINAVLSQIRILRTDLVCPFEWPEIDRDNTDITIEDINLVRNPFPVLPLENGNYLLLDDAPLFRLLAGSGLAHIPAQVFGSQNIEVVSEDIAVVDFDQTDLMHLIARYPQQMIIGEGEKEWPEGFIPTWFGFGDDSEKTADSMTVYLRHSSRTGCPTALEILFRDIFNRGEYYPAIKERPADIVIKVPSPSGIITLPKFDVSELQTAATSERLFPPRIIRPTTDSRVISIDFPMSVLRSDISIEEKQSFLRELIIYRRQNRRTAYIKGQVYILNH